MIVRVKQSFGYSGQSLLTTSHTSRTLNPIDYTQEAMSDLVMKNLRDFRTLVKFNAANELFIYKMKGDLVPIANHPFNTFDWKKPYQHIFESIGTWMVNNAYRLMIEPIDNIWLGREDEEEVLYDVGCLRYYCALLNTIKLGQSHKVLLSIGQYKNQKDGLERFIHSFHRLPKYIREHVVLVNTKEPDSMDDVVYVSKELQIPFVFTYFGRLADFNAAFSPYKRAFLKSWKALDGLPVVQIIEAATNIKTDFMNMVKYDEVAGLSKWVNADDISVLYCSDYKDIAAIKIANTLTEQRGVFLKEACVKEWHRYRHLVMAHDPDAYVMMQHFMEKPTSFEGFYHHIEQIMQRFKLLPNDVFAAEELINDLTPHIKRSERLKAMTFLKDRDMDGLKFYCQALAEACGQSELASSYYYHLN